MLDGTLKTLLVDDSQPVANLMVVICTKIGMCYKIYLHIERDLESNMLEEYVFPNLVTINILMYF